MELEKQVVSLGLSKRLKELGAKQNSLFHHVSYRNLGVEEHDIYSDEKVDSAGTIGWQLTSICSAFTVAELGEMLHYKGKPIIPVPIEQDWRGPDLVKNAELRLGARTEMTEADARAKMLIYLLENNLLTI